MRWFKVILAGLVEIIWVNCMKNADSVLSWGLTLIMIAISFALVINACKSLPVGTAYAIWTGIGTGGGAIISMIFYNESKNIWRILCIGLIVVSSVGLKLIS